MNKKKKITLYTSIVLFLVLFIVLFNNHNKRLTARELKVFGVWFQENSGEKCWGILFLRRNRTAKLLIISDKTRYSMIFDSWRLSLTNMLDKQKNVYSLFLHEKGDSKNMEYLYLYSPMRDIIYYTDNNGKVIKFHRLSRDKLIGLYKERVLTTDERIEIEKELSNWEYQQKF